ncbi:MAG: iron-containing alcohol dehydrogenase, partial [Bacteroidaceae bacterium]|nr:iron-containing alcohol dehydrogenase [Bacteroidaceae bacterium]
MENFVFCTPTNFVFGRGTESQVGKLCIENGATRVLIVYGGGSVVRSGLLDRVRTALTEENLPFGELGGVKPNPEDDLVRIGIDMVRNEHFDFILPVGGGSTIDTAKGIACGALYDGDFWDFYCGKAKIQKALPVGVILTIAAAGSEGSGNSVITNLSNMQKLSLRCPEHLRPRFSILNPELTMTLPPYQTASGICDMMVHIFERYFNNTAETGITDRVS